MKIFMFTIIFFIGLVPFSVFADEYSCPFDLNAANSACTASNNCKSVSKNGETQDGYANSHYITCLKTNDITTNPEKVKGGWLTCTTWFNGVTSPAYEFLVEFNGPSSWRYKTVQDAIKTFCLSIAPAA